MSCLHDNKKDNNINMNISYIHLTLAFHIRIYTWREYVHELSLRNAISRFLIILILTMTWHVSVRLDGVSWWPGMEDTAECCQDARPEPNWSSSLINLHTTHRQHSRLTADTDCHYRGPRTCARTQNIMTFLCIMNLCGMTFRGKRNRNIYSFAIHFNLTWNMEGWLLHCPGRGPPWPVSCLHLNPDTDGSCVQSRSQ